MANRIQVKSVRKTNNAEAHARIDGIGGARDDGTYWYMPLAEAVDGVEAGKWCLWMVANGECLPLVVATCSGHKYLKTEADGEQPDMLLNLPDYV